VGNADGCLAESRRDCIVRIVRIVGIVKIRFRFRDLRDRSVGRVHQTPEARDIEQIDRAR
jgi:hypothetical protein